MMSFEQAFSACPMIAILRGITPEDAVPHVAELIGVGFTLIEIPLNSPSALTSIEHVTRAFGDKAIIGAGTVLDRSALADVHGLGGRLIVAPNFDPDVAAAAQETGMIYGPGVFTPSEIFAALKAGADFLKLFPAEILPPVAVKAFRAVVPASVPLVAVGGITPATIRPYLEAGASGFGLGSGLYRPGQSPAETALHAQLYMAAIAEG